VKESFIDSRPGSPYWMQPASNRDGCECPRWIWSCAHFEDKTIVLDGWSSEPRCSLCKCPSTIHIWLLYEANNEACPQCGMREVGLVLASGDTPKEAALIAFRQAEARLMGREVPS
jgi:hypothetical protein